MSCYRAGMATEETDWTCPRTYRHPKFVRSLALQLWGLRCSRDAACVQRELLARAVEDGLSCVPDVRTIRSWSESEDWSGEVARMMRSIAPDLMGSMVVDLIMAASEGVAYLRGVTSGRESKPNSTRVRAILTALSMVGAPNIAYASMQDTKHAFVPASVDTPAISAHSSVPPEPTPSSDDWKSRLAASFGDTD